MTVNVNIPKPPWWSTGILDPAKHSRLIENRFSVGRRAGLSETNLKYIWEPLPDNVSSIERAWCKAIITGEPTGLGFRYSGNLKAVNRRMHALTGALLRNFVDASIMQTDELVTLGLTGGTVQATVLFIPDLGIVGGNMPDSPKRALMGILGERARNGKFTVVYAPDGLKKIFKTVGEELDTLLAKGTVV